MNWIDLVIFGTILLAFVIFRLKGNAGAKEARERLKAGARLVDVRTRGEFAAGHLPGAINIPLNELRGRLRELHPPEKAVVLYCASGARSALAVSQLRSAGFPAVFNLGAMRNGA